MDYDDDRYDYDVKGPRWDPNSKYNEFLRKEREDKRKEKEQILQEKIKAKGEYIVPDEFEHEIYKDFIDKTKNDPNKKDYDEFDANKLYKYMLTLRGYYADAMYNFYKRYDPTKLKTLSAYILSQISGNKLEFEEINYDREASKANKEKFLIKEKELVKQRKEFYEFQTHHERTIQALFHKKSTFKILQQRGIEAKLMNEMYNQGFFIDLAIKPTKEIKKNLNNDEKTIQDFYQFPIVAEILEEKSSKIKELKDRKEFLIKCRKAKDAMLKLKPLLSLKDTTLENFELYKNSKYVETIKQVIKQSLITIDEVIDQAELAEMDDYYHGIDVFKKD